MVTLINFTKMSSKTRAYIERSIVWNLFYCIKHIFFFKSYVPHSLVLSRVSGGCTLCPQPPHPENIAIFLLLHDILLKSINLSSHSKVHV